MCEKKITAVLIRSNDNVATVFCNAEANSTVEVNKPDGEKIYIKILDDVPFGHKFSVKDIEAGEGIIKYGEKIGIASKSIKKGDYVHIHNLDSMRARGDLEDKEANI